MFELIFLLLLAIFVIILIKQASTLDELDRKIVTYLILIGFVVNVVGFLSGIKLVASSGGFILFSGFLILIYIKFREGLLEVNEH